MTDVVLALIEDQGRFFLQRRDLAARVMPGLWEFPGGKVEAGESLTAALARELQEELAVTPVAAAALDSLAGEPTLHPYRVRLAASPRPALAWGWFSPEEMLHLPIPPRNLELLARIQKG